MLLETSRQIHKTGCFRIKIQAAFFILFKVVLHKIYLHRNVNKPAQKSENKKRGYPFETASFIF